MRQSDIVQQLEPADLFTYVDMSSLASSPEVLFEASGKQVTGWDVAKWLLAYYGGGRIYIPNIMHINSLIGRLINSNRHLTSRQMAAKIGVSEAKIKEIVRNTAV